MFLSLDSSRSIASSIDNPTNDIEFLVSNTNKTESIEVVSIAVPNVPQSYQHVVSLFEGLVGDADQNSREMQVTRQCDGSLEDRQVLIPPQLNPITSYSSTGSIVTLELQYPHMLTSLSNLSLLESVFLIGVTGLDMTHPDLWPVTGVWGFNGDSGEVLIETPEDLSSALYLYIPRVGDLNQIAALVSSQLAAGWELQLTVKDNCLVWQSDSLPPTCRFLLQGSLLDRLGFGTGTLTVGANNAPRGRPSNASSFIHLQGSDCSDIALTPALQTKILDSPCSLTVNGSESIIIPSGNYQSFTTLITTLNDALVPFEAAIQVANCRALLQAAPSFSLDFSACPDIAAWLGFDPICYSGRSEYQGAELRFLWPVNALGQPTQLRQIYQLQFSQCRFGLLATLSCLPMSIIGDNAGIYTLTTVHSLQPGDIVIVNWQNREVAIPVATVPSTTTFTSQVIIDTAATTVIARLFVPDTVTTASTFDNCLPGSCGALNRDLDDAKAPIDITGLGVGIQLLRGQTTWFPGVCYMYASRVLLLQLWVDGVTDASLFQTMGLTNIVAVIPTPNDNALFRENIASHKLQLPDGLRMHKIRARLVYPDGTLYQLCGVHWHLVLALRLCAPLPLCMCHPA